VVGSLCFFGLLAHNSVRLDCCGGAFFPGGIAKNFANRRRVKQREIALVNRDVPRVCCLLMQLKENVCATRRGQVTMTVNM
jgi:hypothetical protein